MFGVVRYIETSLEQDVIDYAIMFVLSNIATTTQLNTRHHNNSIIQTNQLVAELEREREREREERGE